MPVVGEFSSESNALRPGDAVVLKTERGTEIGVVLSAPALVEGETPRPTVGELIRKATAEDKQKFADLKLESAPREFIYCRDKIRELGLQMRLVHVEHILGGEKIIFSFLSDGRVDFRQLVKELAHEYRTRIEMKQIGVRDESRLLGDIAHCGQTLCCARYIKNFDPVTMKMAKSQKATLDPSKISGHCGRLMCCLRYEHEVYSEFQRKLPRKGSRVLTTRGPGQVINYDILAQKVTIETDARVRLTVNVDEVLGRDERKPEELQRDEKKPDERDRRRRNPPAAPETPGAPGAPGNENDGRNGRP
jgi:cell fate regulator YaaT (PSP1 superfamily)